MKNFLPSGVLSLLIGSFLLCPTLFAEVTLVKDGKPNSEIVLSKEATASVRTAAAELQRHLEAMSGARLPIVHEPSSGVENQVYVGESEGTRKLGITLDGVKDDGFKIVTGKNHVVLLGRQIYHFASTFAKFDIEKGKKQAAWEEFVGRKWRFPPIIDYRDFNKENGFHLMDGTGTLYAAYELLGQLGFRWYMPGDLGMVVPELKTISIKDQNLTRNPEFPVRIITDAGYGAFTNEFLWFKSMMVGQSLNMAIYHSVSGPTKLYPEEQPQEYYGVVGGKTMYSVPKLTNERLRADTAEYLVAVDKGFPGMPYVSIGQPDGWSIMDDADAAAGWDKMSERGVNGRFSDYSWEFNMDVRRRVLEKLPEKKFTVFAYYATRRPPTNLDKVPDDVTVVFCETIASWMLPNQELADRNDWISKMSHKNQLLIWEYYLQHAPNYNLPPVPVIFTKLMKESFQGLYDHAAGFLVEGGWSTADEVLRNKLTIRRPGISHITYYLHSRMCWDRNLDVAATMEEYYTLFYGPARAEMKEFFELAEEVWTRSEPRQITANGGFLKPEDVTRYFSILERAAKKAGDTIYGKRVALIATEMEPLKALFEKLKRTGPNLQILATKEKPVIDGDLDKPFWRNDKYSFHPLREMLTGELPAHVSTEVSFRWLNDNSALIVGIECKEPKMNQLKESCQTPDSPGIFSDDMVEVRIETAAGIRPFIAVNSAGVVFDECVTDRLEDLPNFYSVSDVKVKKYADRWTVEMRIDAKPILGERPTTYYPWGVNVCRQRMAGNTPEHYMLSPSGTNFKDIKYMANIFVRK